MPENHNLQDHLLLLLVSALSPLFLGGRMPRQKSNLQKSVNEIASVLAKNNLDEATAKSLLKIHVWISEEIENGFSRSLVRWGKERVILIITIATAVITVLSFFL